MIQALGEIISQMVKVYRWCSYSCGRLLQFVVLLFQRNVFFSVRSDGFGHSV